MYTVSVHSQLLVCTSCAPIPDYSYQGIDFSSLSSLPDYIATTNKPDGGNYEYTVSICRATVAQSQTAGCQDSLWKANSVCQANLNTAKIVYFSLANWYEIAPVQ